MTKDRRYRREEWCCSRTMSINVLAILAAFHPFVLPNECQRSFRNDEGPRALDSNSGSRKRKNDRQGWIDLRNRVKALRDDELVSLIRHEPLEYFALPVEPYLRDYLLDEAISDSRLGLRDVLRDLLVYRITSADSMQRDCVGCAVGGLEVLTTIARLAGKPDPVSLRIDGYRVNRGSKEASGTLSVAFRYEYEPVPGIQPCLMLGGDRAMGRSTRFEIDMRAPNGHPVAQVSKSVSGRFGGFLREWVLSCGETVAVEIPLEEHIAIPQSGRYFVRVRFHNTIPLLGRQDAAYLITLASQELIIDLD